MRIGIAHKNIDFDAASCLRLLEREGLIDDVYFSGTSEFGIKEYEQAQKRLTREIEEMIFIDYKPSTDIINQTAVKVSNYDHHNSATDAQTSFDLLTKHYTLKVFNNNEKLEYWKKLVLDSDTKPSNEGRMDIQAILKKMSLVFQNDKETYNNWFVPLMDSFFDNQQDYERGSKIFQETILAFQFQNKTSPASPTFQRWLERISNLDNIRQATIRNMFHYFACMDEQTAREWLTLTFEALDKWQRSFVGDKTDIINVDIEFFGKTVVVSKVTSSISFGPAVRQSITRSGNNPPRLKEIISNKNIPWLVIKVTPHKKNFQIFPAGSIPKIQQAILIELIKALRAEVLTRKSKLVPDVKELSKAGGVTGTEPLHFNMNYEQKNFSPQILWGSTTHPDVPPATVFGKTSYEIKQTLVALSKYVIDENFFPAECDPKSCKDCKIYGWRLRKCDKKRKEVGVLS